MSAIPERQSATAMSHVESIYDLRDRGARRLLSANPDLIPESMGVANAVTRYFGLDARLALESVIDPEEETPEEELFAVISTTMAPTHALERLNAFDRGWWIERSRHIGSRLTVTLD